MHMFVPFCGKDALHIAKVDADPYSKPGKDQIHPVGKKHYNTAIDPHAHNRRVGYYSSLDEDHRMCVHREDEVQICIKTTDSDNQDIRYNELVFRDSDLGRTVNKRIYGTESVSHASSQSYVTSNTNKYSIKLGHHNKKTFDALSPLDAYNFIRKQLCNERKLSFAGVAFGDISHASVGVSES